jgi:hypothetical protein
MKAIESKRLLTLSTSGARERSPGLLTGGMTTDTQHRSMTGTAVPPTNAGPSWTRNFFPSEASVPLEKTFSFCPASSLASPIRLLLDSKIIHPYPYIPFSLALSVPLSQLLRDLTASSRQLESRRSST